MKGKEGEQSTFNEDRTTTMFGPPHASQGGLWVVSSGRVPEQASPLFRAKPQ